MSTVAAVKAELVQRCTALLGGPTVGDGRGTSTLTGQDRIVVGDVTGARTAAALDGPVYEAYDVTITVSCSRATPDTGQREADEAALGYRDALAGDLDAVPLAVPGVLLAEVLGRFDLSGQGTPSGERNAALTFPVHVEADR